MSAPHEPHALQAPSPADFARPEIDLVKQILAALEESAETVERGSCLTLRQRATWQRLEIDAAEVSPDLAEEVRDFRAASREDLVDVWLSLRSIATRRLHKLRELIADRLPGEVS
jgi:hypothetical protein